MGHYMQPIRVKWTSFTIRRRMQFLLDAAFIHWGAVYEMWDDNNSRNNNNEWCVSFRTHDMSVKGCIDPIWECNPICVCLSTKLSSACELLNSIVQHYVSAIKQKNYLLLFADLREFLKKKLGARDSPQPFQIDRSRLLVFFPSLPIFRSVCSLFLQTWNIWISFVSVSTN